MIDDNMEKNEKLQEKKKLKFSSTLDLFLDAASSGDWELAESLVPSADAETLNYALCFTLESIWFLSTHEEFRAITGLIEKIIANAAYDFKTVVLKTSIFAMCVSAFQTQTWTTLAAALTRTALYESMQEFFPAGVPELIYKSIEYALLKFSCHQGSKDRVHNSSDDVIQLQLSAFKAFLDLASDQLMPKYLSVAFSGVCITLAFLSSSFDPGCTSGIWAMTAIPDFLGALLQCGVDEDIFKLCLGAASQYRSTELVRILLKVAKRNNLDVDVGEPLLIACLNSRLGTVECLVEDGNVEDLALPLIAAARSGCRPIVEWFVKRGFHDTELCNVLTHATSKSQVDVAAYLLLQIPPHLLAKRGIKILEFAGKLGGVDSLVGVAFLLRSDFLGDPAGTYAVANYIARSDENEDVAPELRAFLQEHWSGEAFWDGIRQGQEHYMNIVRILKWGKSPICLDLLAPDLRVAIAYLPLYKECMKAGGCLVSQRLRGQLVEAVKRLGGGVLDGVSQCKELLDVLKHRLAQFVLDN